MMRILPAIAVIAVGIAVSVLIQTPFGLLAPVTALFLYASGRTRLLLHAASAAGLVGSLLVAALQEGGTRDFALVWAAFFALAICIGVLVASRTSHSAEAIPAAIPSTRPDGSPSYPIVGPTLHEKAAPRHSPFVGITAEDDGATASRLVAVSFWGGTPLHLRYWRCDPDGRYRWVESRSEPLREPSSTGLWSSVSADIDDQRPGQEPPTRIASNPPSNDDAVRAAKIVENLFGNAWAFDAVGRPTYLSPLAQTFVGATLEEFQAVVDEGHTFFKRTAHPDDYDRISALWRRSLQTGDPLFLNRRIRRASGIHEWNRTGIVPTRDRRGRVTGWYGTTIDLDAHRIAEAELRERERELQQLIDTVPVQIWCVQPSGEPSYINKNMADYIGVKLDELPEGGLAAAIQLIVHPDDRAALHQALTHSFSTGEPFGLKFRNRRWDGVYRWTEGHALPLRDNSGRIIQWYGANVDIHDFVISQEALRDRELELSQLVNMVPVHIRRLTPQGEPIFFNKRLIDFFGLGDLSDLDRPGMSRLAAAIQNLVHTDDSTRLLETARRSFGTGEPFSMKYRMRRADGAYRWMDTRAEPLRNQSGAILEWYVISLDIDDEVRAQEALQRSERELSKLVDMVPVHIRRLTPEFEAIFWNKRAIDFIGLEPAELRKRSQAAAAIQAFVHPDDATSVREAIRRCLATGEPWALRYRLRRADGVYRWVEGRSEPIRNQDGTIEQWYAVSVDIDDHMRVQEAEEALREASDRLAKATQAASLAEVSASIAHEVNQPLAAIVANAHACQRWLSVEPANVERAKVTVDRIIRDANSAADVVSRIRALFKQSVEARDSTPLSDAIVEARNLMAEEASRRGVQMKIDVESNLPLVAFDRVQIQQVLINLIQNGFDAMDTTPNERILGMRVHRNGSSVQTEISDHGRGIEFPDRIFEPFFTTKKQGMGMGLAICRSIIESHGGRLWAERNEPRGATFIFTLPVEMKSNI